MEGAGREEGGDTGWEGVVEGYGECCIARALWVGGRRWYEWYSEWKV